jgi:hypothetical protein
MSPRIETIDDYEALAYSAAEDFNRKDYEKALAKFLDMKEANPGNKKLHEVLFYIFLRLDRIEEAEKERLVYLDLAREENPHLFQLRTFDNLVEEAGDLKEVKNEFDRLMKKKDIDIFEALEIFNKLNVLYLAREEYEKAGKAADQLQEKYKNLQ